MSELSKLQRSKQRVLEMMEQLKKNVNAKHEATTHCTFNSVVRDLQELDKAVQFLNNRLAKIKEVA